MDPRIPTPDQCVLRNLLDGFDATQPDKVFCKFYDHGREWTYREMRNRARRVSGALYHLGLRQKQNVFAWLPNGGDFLETWFGTNYMGGVFISANIAYRGGLLEHVIDLAKAEIGIIHADLLPRLAEISPKHLKKVIVIGGAAVGDYPGIELIDQSILQEDWGAAPIDEPIMPWDSIYVIYTSGTTGPSKAVLSSYVHAYGFFSEAFPALVGRDQRHMVFLPMFHAGGAAPLFSQLTKGGSVGMVESFKTNDFWKMVRETEATCCCLLGVMAPFLLKQPPDAGDRMHTLKACSITPLSDDALAFRERFGVDLCTGYGMSELCGPIASGINPPKLGVSGKLRPGFDARLVDEHDNEVPVGEVGEFVIRSERPWQFLTEYYGDPVATAKAWRNGWFHTGDLLRKDDEGWYYFVDRRKDAMRRRGENISSHEVEMEIFKHSAIREVAAYAVQSEIAEDEVMICVSFAPGQTLDHAELIEFIIPRMPHYAIPRYIRVMDTLPKTPTGKLLKEELRKEGITPDTWDREAHGIVIRRQKIGA